eukprot:7391175-Prymnesium_polylepis.1
MLRADAAKAGGAAAEPSQPWAGSPHHSFAAPDLRGHRTAAAAAAACVPSPKGATHPTSRRAHALRCPHLSLSHSDQRLDPAVEHAFAREARPRHANVLEARGGGVALGRVGLLLEEGQQRRHHALRSVPTSSQRAGLHPTPRYRPPSPDPRPTPPLTHRPLHTAPYTPPLSHRPLHTALTHCAYRAPTAHPLAALNTHTALPGHHTPRAHARLL